MEFEQKPTHELIHGLEGQTAGEPIPESVPGGVVSEPARDVAPTLPLTPLASPTSQASPTLPAQAPAAPPPPTPRQNRGNGLWSYLMVGLVGAIIGGFLVIGIAPQVLLTKGGFTGLLPGRVQTTAPNTQIPTAPLTWDGDPWQIVAEVAEKVSPSVVGIVNTQGGLFDFFGRELLRDTSGSGLIITSDGYIVTNNHVVEGQKGLKVYLADGRELPATVIGTDPRTDLAVVKIEATGLPVAVFGNSDKLRPGELAVAIGNPLGLDFSRTVTSGVVSGLNRVVDISQEASVRLIQTDAVINPGNSGGPLVNASGEVIGLNSLKLVTSQVEGMGFAIPSNMVVRVTNEIMATGAVRRALIGVTLADVPVAVRELEVKLPVERGAYIDSVNPGSPGEKAGLRKGDVIVAMDGVTVNSVSTLRALLAERAPGEIIELKVARGTQELTLKVTLGSASDVRQ
ncbi:MAG: S1C family serine protease [Bacillota bacterium]